MRAVASIVFLSVTLSAPTFAAQSPTEQKIAACAATKGDLARLQCFDSLAESLHLNGPQPLGTGAKAGKTGKWDISKEKNPVDDSITAIAALRSDSGVSRFGKPVVLVLRCQAGHTEVYINWGSFLGEDGAMVLTRIGDATATTSMWGLSSDHTASFYPDDDTAFIKQLMDVDSFVAQVTPYDESPVRRWSPAPMWGGPFRMHDVFLKRVLRIKMS